MIVGLVVSASSIATASPAIRLLDLYMAPHASNIELVGSSWNHRQDHHRSWDRRPRH
jgi:hypothetical protein